MLVNNFQHVQLAAVSQLQELWQLLVNYSSFGPRFNGQLLHMHSISSVAPEASGTYHEPSKAESLESSSRDASQEALHPGSDILFSHPEETIKKH